MEDKKKKKICMHTDKMLNFYWLNPFFFAAYNFVENVEKDTNKTPKENTKLKYWPEEHDVFVLVRLKVTRFETFMSLRLESHLSCPRTQTTPSFFCVKHTCQEKTDAKRNDFFKCVATFTLCLRVYCACVVREFFYLRMRIIKNGQLNGSTTISA